MSKKEENERPEVLQEQEISDNSEMENGSFLSSLIKDDDEEMPDLHHVKDLMRVLSIDGQWFKRQIGVILLIVAGIIWYITNRYQAQQEMIEEDKLRAELADWKFRSMTKTSELTLHTRQTFLEDRLKALGDSTLKASAVPPFILRSK